MRKSLTKRLFLLFTIGTTAIILLMLCSCTPSAPTTTQSGTSKPSETGEPVSYLLPGPDGKWSPPVQQKGRRPTGVGQVKIEDIGEFSFEAQQVETLRTDVFQPGYFSVFDVLVHLSDKGDIKMDYHFDGNMDTYLIDAINGQPHWWYQAKYSGGWYESNVFRMDMYPYKDGAEIRLSRQREEYLARICRTFGDEV